jgi:hypothetical protein
MRYEKKEKVSQGVTSPGYIGDESRVDKGIDAD